MSTCGGKSTLNWSFHFEAELVVVKPSCNIFKEPTQCLRAGVKVHSAGRFTSRRSL